MPPPNTADGSTLEVSTTGDSMIAFKSDRGGHGPAAVSRQHPLADDAPRPWYVLALLLPALIAAILLGVLAFMSAWWLWPVVVRWGCRR